MKKVRWMYVSTVFGVMYSVLLIFKVKIQSNVNIFFLSTVVLLAVITVYDEIKRAK